MQLSVIIKKNKKGSQEKPIFVIIGKKILKKATQRNLIKRRIKNILNPVINNLRYDIIVIAKKGIEKTKNKELEEEIIKILNHERIIF